MFQFSKKGPIEYLAATELCSYDFLIHAFCTRRGGISEGNFISLNFSSREGDSAENVRQNWKILVAAFNLEIEQFFVVNQVHGDKILIIDHPVDDIIRNQPHQCDAIITDQPGLAIGIKTADCVPVFFVDKKKRIIGVAHAGWKGTSLNITAKVVDAFVKKFSCHTDDIVAVIGPSIGPCCYQVDDIVFDSMKEDKDRESFFSPCCMLGRWMFDLPLANRHQIIGRGITPANVFATDYCTSCNTGIFFSHRREGASTGRQLNFIMLT
ncbi:MAG TPA: peptidoglycan editing factor PgeF [Syntrophales bacterium]|nr:peptidoglycan editing factor PgeF [Syntrophales bacterium]